MSVKACLHFVGFRDDSYNRAIRVFGKPDFVHRWWDHRAVSDVAPNDTVVFADLKNWQRFTENRPVPYAFDDSACF